MPLEMNEIRIKIKKYIGIIMKKLFRIIGWIVFAILVVVTFSFLWNKTRKPRAQYAVETVKQNDTIENKIVLTGTIQPRDEVAIKPQMTGIVAELLHKPGDIVQAGDVIARLSVVPEMIQVNSSMSRVKVAEITFDQRKEKYLRDEELFKKGVIAKEEFEASKAAYEQQQEELNSAIDALQIVRKGVSNRSARETSTLVRATISGKILTIPVKVGNSVIQANNFSEGTTIATIANMDDLLFIGKVDETEVGRLNVDMPMAISVGAVAEKKYHAVVEYISPKGDDKTGATLFEIKGALAVDKNDDIRAGYSANADVVTERAVNVLSLPENCIEFRNDSTFVQLVTKENPLETKELYVKTGVSNGLKIEIKSGLKSGQKVRGIEKSKKD